MIQSPDREGKKQLRLLLFDFLVGFFVLIFVSFFNLFPKSKRERLISVAQTGCKIHPCNCFFIFFSPIPLQISYRVHVRGECIRPAARALDDRLSRAVKDTRFLVVNAP